MRDVAVIAFAQAPNRRDAGAENDVELLMPVVAQAVEDSGLAKRDIGFVCSGSGRTTRAVARVQFSIDISVGHRWRLA